MKERDINHLDCAVAKSNKIRKLRKHLRRKVCGKLVSENDKAARKRLTELL